MKNFKDIENREWSISLTISSIKRVKSLIDVDLLALDQGTPPLLTRLALDIELFCNVLYLLIKPQADKRELSDEQFGEALDGDTILKAHECFYQELEDFFQGLGRSDLVKAIQAQKKVINLAVKKVEETINQIDLEKVLGNIDVPISGKSSTSSQG